MFSRPFANRATLIALACLVLYACRDIAAPVTGAIAPATRTAYLSPPGVTFVTPDSMHGWTFYDDQRGAACTNVANCRLTADSTSRGSAELAVATQSDGNALILQDYAGTRLDAVTDLAYSTYRQSADAGHNLAIALQLTVDYDLADQSLQYQGRLVYEPYQSGGGNVPDRTWQRWNTRAGKWWGTKSSVRKSDAVVTNPCVQAHPCTWTALLAAFPNLGVHPTYGAVVLKAGSGWMNFRGNVDSLSIGINGVLTTFDFETVSGRRFAMRSDIDSTVIATGWAADSSYPAGTQLAYSFTARPGRATPVVLLDDTLAAAVGHITMDRNHELWVQSDTIITYAQLLPLERQIADRIGTLLTATDKVAASQAIHDGYLQLLVDGVSPDNVSKAAEVARDLMMDEERDSTALRQVNDALDGYYFYTHTEADGSFTTWHEFGRPAFSDPGEASARIPQPSGINPSRGIATPPMTASSTPQHHHIVGSRLPRASTIGRSSLVNSSETAPSEHTVVIYTNGVANDEAAASATAALVQDLVGSQPAFVKDNYKVIYKYNKNSSAQLTEYNLLHPCTKPIGGWLRKFTALGAMAKFAVCKVRHGAQSVTGNDFVETFTSSIEVVLHFAPSDDAANELALDIQRYHQLNNHVLLIGHSEGTIIDAAAVQRLPTFENHPVQAGPYCVGAIALAPPLDRPTYALDDFHVFGFIAEHDAVTLSGLATGWESVQTDLSNEAGVAIRRLQSQNTFKALIAAAKYGYEIHSVNTTYLAPPVRDIVGRRLATLNNECVAGSLALSLSASSVPVNSTVTAAVTVLNKNGRPLLRPVELGAENNLAFVGGMTLRAMMPTYRPAIVVASTSGLQATASVTIPPVLLPQPTYSEELYDLGWDAIGASNGDQDGSGTLPTPAIKWDGSFSCSRVIRVNGAGTSWVDFQLRGCGRNYRITSQIPGTLSSGRRVQTHIRWRDSSSVREGDIYSCGEIPCILDMWVDQENWTTDPAVNYPVTYVVASSRAPQGPGQPSPLRLVPGTLRVRSAPTAPGKRRSATPVVRNSYVGKASDPASSPPGTQLPPVTRASHE